MLFDNKYKNRKDKRQDYKGAKAISRSCRNHGGCPYCQSGRKYKIKKTIPLLG